MSCFDCKYCKMCYVFKAMHDAVQFNTNSLDYPKNHDKFYRTMAEVCEAYEKDITLEKET